MTTHYDGTPVAKTLTGVDAAAIRTADGPTQHPEGHPRQKVDPPLTDEARASALAKGRAVWDGLPPNKP